MNWDGQLIVDVELTEQLQRKATMVQEEMRANDEAAEFLVPKAELDNFIIRVVLCTLNNELCFLRKDLECIRELSWGNSSSEKKCHIRISISTW